MKDSPVPAQTMFGSLAATASEPMEATGSESKNAGDRRGAVAFRADVAILELSVYVGTGWRLLRVQERRSDSE